MGKKKKSENLSLPKVNLAKNQGYTVVIPIFDELKAEWLLETGLNLARSHNGRVVLVGMVLVPEGQSLTAGTSQAQVNRAILEELRLRYEDYPIYIKPRIRVDHKPWQALTKIIAKEQADVVILPWYAEDVESMFALPLDALLGHLDCNIVVVSGNTPHQLKNILMPLRGSQESPFALEVSLSLAKATGAGITMLYAKGEDPKPSSQRIYQELVRITQGNPHIKRELQVDGSALAAILAHAGEHDLIVMGASEAAPGRAAQEIGKIPRALQRQNPHPLIVVRTHHPPPLEEISQWNIQAPLPATPTAVLVDKWFAENTFSSQEFKDLKRLVALKEEQNLTISLGLPALNEEETIGTIIQSVKGKLMDNVPLLDEIILIDSGSTDYTVAIAQDHGLPVVQHSDILPQYDSFRGKGEALWKSLYVLKGDIIAWIDTDIVNIHPRFVYGILGPLLRHQTIQYVKGFYRRPLKVGNSLQAGGGGRVTELVARPFFNLFYPELSGIVQPLSGEYAGRRSALEKVPFYVGYGVETGLLLNLVEQYGINGIAQVDLLQRIHHNQSLSALSQMAFAIIQVFIDHLEHRKRVELLSEINRTMKIIRYDVDAFRLEERPISDRRRQPMITLPEYRAKFGVTDWKAAAEYKFKNAIPEREVAG